MDPDGKAVLSIGGGVVGAVLAGGAVGAVASFVGTLMGGGCLSDAFASMPVGFLSGAAMVIAAFGGILTSLGLGIGIYFISAAQALSGG